MLRSWWNLVLALGNLARHTICLFLHDPHRVLKATFHHYFGDREVARQEIRAADESLRSKRLR